MTAVEQWRAILGRQVAQARQIVQKLLTEKITFQSEDRDGRPGFRFRATGTVEKLVAGVVPGSLQAVVSPTGEIWNTVFAQLESFNSLRDMSLAA